MPQNFTSQDLRGKSFKGQDLTGANFSNADIRGTDFSNTILTDANFSGVKAGMRSRPLMRFAAIIIFCLTFGTRPIATIVEAPNNISRIYWIAISLMSACYSYIITFASERTSFHKANLHNTNFTSAQLKHADFNTAIMENTNFSQAKV
jgi:uncharacterized protein YjbI with pentapeptide repeats